MATAPAAARPAIDPLRNRRRAYRGISAGITLICVGAVLLLNTLGMVGWGVWFDLLKLWPLVLISIGVRWIFVNSRAHAFCLIGPALVALGTVWVVSSYDSAAEKGPAAISGGETIDVDCPAPAPGDTAHLDLEFAAGSLRLYSEKGPATVGAASSLVATGFHGTLLYSGREPRHTCGGSGSLHLGHDTWDDGVHIALPFGDWESRWEARLYTSSPVFLEMKLAASNAELDLRAFTLDRVEVDVAASRLELQLGQARGRVPVRIHGAVDDLRLVIPEGTCYTVSRERILSVLDIDDRVSKDRRWKHLTSDACASAAPDAPRYEIRYELPVSSVTIETEGRRT
ncbi:MAG TPA: DUF5668 domain-containing protein [Patescibacteria group bacterium]|nr:DUF5668 domain-containing protein [Patescibacteria group bacterium]